MKISTPAETVDRASRQLYRNLQLSFMPHTVPFDLLSAQAQAMFRTAVIEMLEEVERDLAASILMQVADRVIIDVVADNGWVFESYLESVAADIRKGGE